MELAAAGADERADVSARFASRVVNRQQRARLLFASEPKPDDDDGDFGDGSMLNDDESSDSCTALPPEAVLNTAAT